MDESTEILKNIFNNNKKGILISLLVFVLVAGNLVFGYLYFVESSDCSVLKIELQKQQKSAKVINFTKLFIEKVLKAQGEVSFEERLKLENSVRDLQDQEILAQWEKFTSSKTEADAQTQVKDLLSLLTAKIVY